MLNLYRGHVHKAGEPKPQARKSGVVKMIEVNVEDDHIVVLVAGKEVEILDADGDQIIARCNLADLANESAQLPDGLTLQVHSENGFGTNLFYEVELTSIAATFRCHHPNKFWEGQYGLATFLAAVRDQAEHHDHWKVTDIELEDDWKQLTLERVIVTGELLEASIRAGASELNIIVHAAEVALSGLPWKPYYSTSEDSFCRELLHPLLRRMGFVFVRYTHGTKEYGKDFTFSETTPFGHHRHYGLQAKAGDVSGSVNAAIDELLGQIKDAFAMPYYELGSKDPRYISTFIIAVSGKFTENAREKIVEKMPKGVIGSVYFLDKERISELVERYWKK